MKRKRRQLSPFSLSFLDIMFCGFGAVVLLVLVLDHDTLRASGESFADLRGEIVGLEREVLVGDKKLASIRSDVAAGSEELAKAAAETDRAQRRIAEVEEELSQRRRQTLATRADIKQLRSDLKTAEAQKKRLGAPIAGNRDGGGKVHSFAGEGDRQYLTGLKMGGKRILILVDASASMLDETIVNVIRRRNMDAARKIEAPKWKRTLATVEWLVSNLPVTARFQIYTFNTRAAAVSGSTSPSWLQASSAKQVAAALESLSHVVPSGGTSLYRAYASVRGLVPRPDNIFLITDGLPTQGRAKPSSTTVSAAQRMQLFESAQPLLPAGVPVNVILLPMEGDMPAAAAYWKLALDTHGSFLTPARDWP